MIITDIVKLATEQSKQKMFEFGKKLNTQQLTAELADQISMALQNPFPVPVLLLTKSKPFIMAAVVTSPKEQTSVR